MSEELTKICPACDGSGELATSHRFTCYECKGFCKVTESEYVRILANEREIRRNFDANLRSAEYRSMGG